MTVSGKAWRAERKPQLAYSDIQGKMHDEAGRIQKARKILKVLHHYLGRDDLAGLRALDIGASTGFIAAELAGDGAMTTGIDIDEPGIMAARARVGDAVELLVESADAMPFPDESFDIVVLNHIYEHVVDADAVVREIHRVLKVGGVAYLGLANRYQLMEPHYRLPLLSWLPQRAADVYIRRAGKAEEYYEKHLSRRNLKTLVRGFHVYDYTIPVIGRPDLFGSDDQVPGAVARLPARVVSALLPIVPTYIWIATKTSGAPRGVPVDGLAHLDLTGVVR